MCYADVWHAPMMMRTLSDRGSWEGGGTLWGKMWWGRKTRWTSMKRRWELKEGLLAKRAVKEGNDSWDRTRDIDLKKWSKSPSWLHFPRAKKWNVVTHDVKWRLESFTVFLEELFTLSENVPAWAIEVLLCRAWLAERWCADYYNTSLNGWLNRGSKYYQSERPKMHEEKRDTDNWSKDRQCTHDLIPRYCSMCPSGLLWRRRAKRRPHTFLFMSIVLCPLIVVPRVVVCSGLVGFLRCLLTLLPVLSLGIMLLPFVLSECWLRTGIILCAIGIFQMTMTLRRLLRTCRVLSLCGPMEVVGLMQHFRGSAWKRPFAQPWWGTGCFLFLVFCDTKTKVLSSVCKV